MHTLILVAHGSRLLKANQEFLDLVDKVKTAELLKYHHLIGCFLEATEPSLEQTIRKAVEKSKAISIFPYFLNQGKHITQDIPNIVSDFQKSYPKCQFKVLDYLGKSPKIVSLILSQL